MRQPDTPSSALYGHPWPPLLIESVVGHLDSGHDVGVPTDKGRHNIDLIRGTYTRNGTPCTKSNATELGPLPFPCGKPQTRHPQALACEESAPSVDVRRRWGHNNSNTGA